LIHRIQKIVIFTPLLDTALLLLFSVIVLGSGQRSVWLAVGLGLILIVWLYRHRAVLLSKIVMLGLVGVMGLITAMIMFPEATSGLVDKFSGIIDPSDDKNASWRMAGWQAQWVQMKQNILFGEGVGNYYSWKFRGQYEVKANPHNAYIQMMLKFGLFGLILYSLAAIQFFRKTLRVRRRLRPGPMKAYIELGVLTFGATHAYMLGYGIHPFALAFFGIGICAAKLAWDAAGHPAASVSSQDGSVNASSVAGWRAQPIRRATIA
jgi:O-antigen ligase